MSPRRYWVRRGPAWTGGEIIGRKRRDSHRHAHRGRVAANLAFNLVPVAVFPPNSLDHGAVAAWIRSAEGCCRVARCIGILVERIDRPSRSAHRGGFGASIAFLITSARPRAPVTELGVGGTLYRGT